MISDFVSERFSSDGPPGAARRAVAFAIAVVLHAAVLWALAASLSFRFEEPEEVKHEPKIIAMAPRETPPPDVVQIGPIDLDTQRPRFRPRVPTVSRQIQEGDPALAVWTYLCNRDGALGPMVKVVCPDPPAGDVNLGLLDPLNRRGGDFGMLFGRSTKTMPLDEAGVARGWTKPKPKRGQDGLVGTTDNSGVPNPVLDESLPTKGKTESVGEGQ